MDNKSTAARATTTKAATLPIHRRAMRKRRIMQLIRPLQQSFSHYPDGGNFADELPARGFFS
jgi:hypothetical protein